MRFRAGGENGSGEKSKSEEEEKVIYIFSHDLSLSDKITESLPGKDGELFTDEARLASGLHESDPDGILFDLRTGSRPLKLMERIYFERPSVIVLALLPGIGTPEEISADKELYWPVEPEEVVEVFHKVQEDRRLLESVGIMGRSEELARAAETVRRIAPSDISVLITGPSGAGKEVIARAIHSISDRSDKPFIAANVAALS
jgi:two-component system response regulator GlrR